MCFPVFEGAGEDAVASIAWGEGRGGGGAVCLHGGVVGAVAGEGEALGWVLVCVEDGVCGEVGVCGPVPVSIPLVYFLYWIWMGY